MRNTGKMIFSINELVAIYSALESQIETCHDLLDNYDVELDETVQLAKVIQHSETALITLNEIFKENNINPHKN